MWIVLSEYLVRLHLLYLPLFPGCTVRLLWSKAHMGINLYQIWEKQQTYLTRASFQVSLPRPVRSLHCCLSLLLNAVNELVLQVNWKYRSSYLSIKLVMVSGGFTYLYVNKYLSCSINLLLFHQCHSMKLLAGQQEGHPACSRSCRNVSQMFTVGYWPNPE